MTAGLILGHKSPVIQTGQSRLNERVNWATIQFLLENAVFLLIGLQARRIIVANSESDLPGPQIAGFCAAVLGGVIVIRLLWVLGTRPFLFRRDKDTGDAPVPWSYALVIGWAGLRGVVTLAAAFLIPEGVQFRDTLIFAAMIVTAGTLLLQGLTLPLLVRVLRLRGPDARSDALQAATLLETSSIAAIAHLGEMVGPNDSPETVQLLRERMQPDQLLCGKSSAGPATTRLRPSNTGDCGYRLSTWSGTKYEDPLQRHGRPRHRRGGSGSFDIEESMLTVATERTDRLAEEEPVATRQPYQPVPVVTSKSAPRQRQAEWPGHLRGLHPRGHAYGAPAYLPHLRERGMPTPQLAHAELSPARWPVMRSFEPGESWRWCFIDERIG